MKDTALNPKSGEAGQLVCDICPHSCLLSEGQSGRCRTRKNEGGRIVSLNYGFLTSLALDPIEKKPLRNFHPGSSILSVGSFGCNLNCPFCQNHEISRAGEEIGTSCERMSPEELCNLAIRLKQEGRLARGSKEANIGLAYTYNEPLMGWEYVLETAQRIRRAGLCNVLVTAGNINARIAELILPVTDALNIDLKCFDRTGYQRLGGDFDTVCNFIVHAHELGCHVELTTLIVPGLSDSEEDMEREAAWIADLDPEIPLHVTRYFPAYKMMHAPTDTALMQRLLKIAKRELKNVYLGNV